MEHRRLPGKVRQELAVKTTCQKDCPDRSITCHGTCEKYLATVEENKKLRDERSKGDCVRDYCYDLSGRKLKLIQKRKQR